MNKKNNQRFGCVEKTCTITIKKIKYQQIIISIKRAQFALVNELFLYGKIIYISFKILQIMYN